MKKNLKAILVSTMLAAFAVGGLAACDKHTHSYDNACDTTCNGCGEVRTVGDHVYDNACDFDCNECGEERETPNHVYDNACDTACNECGEVREIQHTYDNACDAVCNVCEEERVPAEHTGGTASCTQQAQCGVCGQPYGDLLQHSFNKLVMDGEQHYLACDCGLEKENSREAHSYDTWNTEDPEYDYLACACGATDESVAFKKTVTDARQEFYASAATAAITMNGCSEYASVVSVTLGGVSLGNDISALDLSAIKEEKQLHGEQSLAVTVLDASGAEHTVSVPVLIVTADIATGADLYLAVYPNESVEQTNDNGGKYVTSPVKKYGYYRLTANVDFRVAELQKTLPYAYLWAANPNNGSYDGVVAGYDLGYFAGTIDGQNHKITTAGTTYGTFNSLNGATIKNVVLDDYYYYGSNGWATLLAHTVKNTTLENVSVIVTFTSSAPSAEAGANKGYFVANTFTGNTFKNVTIDLAHGNAVNGLALGSLLGSGMDGSNVFENCALLNCGGMVEFGHDALGSYDAVEGFAAYVTAEIDPSYNTGIDVGGTEYELFLVDPNDPANTSGVPEGMVVTNVLYNGADLGDSLIINPSEIFTLADLGTRRLQVKATYKGNVYFTYNVDVEVVTDKQMLEKTYGGERKQLILSVQGVNASLDLTGVTELEGYTVSGINYGTYSLGTDATALTVPEALLADVAAHGEQTVTVVAENDSAILSLSIPVTMYTKGITTAEEFSSIFTYAEQKTYRGYYLLLNDIGGNTYQFNAAARSAGNCEWHSYGFCGTFDGGNHTVTGDSASGGLFGWLGDGATVKNLNVIDVSYGGNQHEAVLSRTTAKAVIENVSVKLVPMEGGQTPTIKSGDNQVYGWITSHYNIGTTFKNVTFDMEGYEATALFGATTYCGFGVTNSSGDTPNNDPVTFENAVIKAKLRSLGYRVDKGVYSYITVEDQIAGGADITYYTEGAVSEKNVIKINSEANTLTLGEKYADAEVLSIVYGTSELGTDLTLKGSSFTEADYGTHSFIVTVKDGKVITKLTVPVTVNSGVEIIEVTLEGRQDVILQGGANEAFAINLGEYADGTVSSITASGYNLGTDPANLNMTELAADTAKHGVQDMVVAMEKGGKLYEVTVPVTVVTRAFASVTDFRNKSSANNTWSGENPFKYDTVMYGYYILLNDIGQYTSGGNFDVIDFGNPVATKPSDMYWTDSQIGFRGTFDGRGHSIAGLMDKNYGLFAGIGNGAVIKDTTFVLGQYYAKSTYKAILADTMNDATVENVTVRVVTVFEDAESAADCVGLLFFRGACRNTFKNLQIISEGAYGCTGTIGGIFGCNGYGFHLSGGNTFENCSIKAINLLSLGGTPAAVVGVNDLADKGLTVTLTGADA